MELATPSLLDEMWTSSRDGCGRKTGKVAGSLSAEYGEGTPFSGYTAQIGFSLTLAPEAGLPERERDEQRSPFRS